MKNTKYIISLILVLSIAASFAFAACDTATTPPGHVCRHLCPICDKCTDATCDDPECEDKCTGHAEDNNGKPSDDGNQQQTPPSDNGNDDEQTTPPSSEEDENNPPSTGGEEDENNPPSTGGEDVPINPEVPTDSLTVTLLGLDVSGITTNFASSEAWTDYTRTLDGPAEGSRFYLPYGSLQMGSSLLFVSREGFKLVGWKCSEHEGVVHAPGENHPVTKAVTFTAVWQLKQASSDFDGIYVADEPFVVIWAGVTFIRLEIVGTTLVFYDEGGGEFQQIELDINGNVAVGTNGSFITFTLTLDGDTLTVSAKRNIGAAIVGVFTKQN